MFYIQSSRNVHTADNYEADDDEEHITLFSTEKQFEVKSGSLEHLSGRSSSRYVPVIVFLFLLLLLYTGRSHFMPTFYARSTFMKNTVQIKHKIPINTCISWGLSY
jgi:hypothetical protein